jgi:hypothetical protein
LTGVPLACASGMAEAFRDRMQSLGSSKEASASTSAQRLSVRLGLHPVRSVISDRFAIRPYDLKRKSTRSRKRTPFSRPATAAWRFSKSPKRMRVSGWTASKIRLTARKLSATDRQDRRRVDKIRAALS